MKTKILSKVPDNKAASLFGVAFSAKQNAALLADDESPRWDLNPPQREEYYNDTEYAFGLRDYADRLIANGSQK